MTVGTTLDFVSVAIATFEASPDGKRLWQFSGVAPVELWEFHGSTIRKFTAVVEDGVQRYELFVIFLSLPKSFVYTLVRSSLSPVADVQTGSGAVAQHLVSSYFTLYGVDV